MTDALIVDFRQQIFNDALFTLEQARNLDPLKTSFEYWKYCTWSIVLSAICIESYIKSHIRSMTDEIDPNILVIYEQNTKLGFYACVRFIENLTDKIIINDSDSDWQNIAATITLRNDIVHFNRPNIFNSITVVNAANGIKACRDFIKKFHLAMDMPYINFAPWIDKTKSENYDTPK